MNSARVIYTASWVLPISAPPIRDGAVCVDGSRITMVGPAVDLLPHSSDARHVVLGHAVLMPGLVNAHTHLELTAMRGFLEGLDFREWLRILTMARRDVMDADALLDASRYGVCEALRNGITTCADTTESGVPLVAMREMGVRGIGYLEVFGPDPFQSTASLTKLRAHVDLTRVHDTTLVRTGVSPHAPYTVSAPLFREVAKYASAEALPVAVHVAESTAETQFVRDGRGPFADRLRAREIAVGPQARSPVALLHQTGILDTRPLLIHAIHLDDDDRARIAGAGASIVHCPISNAKLGHGIAALHLMRDAGIATGLGTDSVASNDRMDLLSEARQATLFQALQLGVPDALSAHDALDLATRGGARALGLEACIGTLETGKDADLAAFPLDDVDALPMHDPSVTLVHVLAGTVKATLVTVAGRELLRDGIILDADHGLSARISVIGERLHLWRTNL